VTIPQTLDIAFGSFHSVQQSDELRHQAMMLLTEVAQSLQGVHREGSLVVVLLLDYFHKFVMHGPECQSVQKDLTFIVTCLLGISTTYKIQDPAP
jgi:hypothetical protein